MNRHIINDLYNWKNKKRRKPLILRGARQVGKTWLMTVFAKQAFEKHIYINFENNEQLKNLFVKDFDIKRILLDIYLATGVRPSEDTLLLFDEIQEAPRGVTALKYFYEQMPQQPVIAAGSLLGISMHTNDSFPVGKVDFLTVYPLSFFEFMEAVGEVRFVELLQQKNWEQLSPFTSHIEDILRHYYYVGGMPEVVANYAEDRDPIEVRELQKDILDAYDRDFSKHAPVNEVPRLRMIWNSIIGQLSKENKKFIYGFIKEGARAKDFEIALEWLQDAGLVYKVHRAKKAAIPLTAYQDFSAFKLFMLDVGLLGAMGNLSSKTLIDGNSIFTDFKGAMTEQYVLQQLKLKKNSSIFYWSAENSSGEIDFLVQSNDSIYPIEVKSEENLQSKSLRAFVQKNSYLHGLRFSMSGYREQDWMTNYPLYSLDSLF
ncbi:MAG: ATP-binding protein [Bacteroidales bacterium]|nr:ATP-binding protein [Bacteroidales bacterium]